MHEGSNDLVSPVSWMPGREQVVEVIRHHLIDLRVCDVPLVEIHVLLGVGRDRFLFQQTQPQLSGFHALLHIEAEATSPSPGQVPFSAVYLCHTHR